jgi:hypothetical protein
MMTVDECGSHTLNEEMRSTCLKWECGETIIKDLLRNAEKEKGSSDWQDVRPSKYDRYG